MGVKARTVKFYSTVSDRSEVVHLIARLFNVDGGPGSGNHGHKGRPGKVGGSAPEGEGGSAATETSKTASKAPSEFKSSASKHEKTPESLKKRIDELGKKYEDNAAKLTNLVSEVAENAQRMQSAFARGEKEAEPFVKRRDELHAEMKAISQENMKIAAEKTDLEAELYDLETPASKMSIAQRIENAAKEQAKQLEIKNLREREDQLKKLIAEVGSRSAYKMELKEIRRKIDELENPLDTPEKVENKLIDTEEEKAEIDEKIRQNEEKFNGIFTAMMKAKREGDEEEFQKQYEANVELMKQGEQLKEKRRSLETDERYLRNKLQEFIRRQEEEERVKKLVEKAEGSEETESVLSAKIELKEKELFDIRHEIDKVYGEVRDLKEKIQRLQNEGNDDEADKVEEEYYEKKAEYDGLIYQANYELQHEIEELEERKKDLAKSEEQKEADSLGISLADLHRQKALDIFGTTDDWNEAGWILPSGDMLNFSDGDNHTGSREHDHRDIARAFSGAGEYGTHEMRQFRNDGNIRFYPEIPGLNIASGTELTEDQEDRIRELVDTFNDEGVEQFCIDFSSSDGDMYGQLAYTVDPDQVDDHTQFFEDGLLDADEIIRDLREHLETGEITEEFGRGTWSHDKKPKQLSK